MFDAANENTMFLEQAMNTIRRRGSRRVHIGGAGLAAWSLLSSQVLCGVAWCADAPAAVPPTPAPVVAPVAPTPLAGLSFLIVALDDAELARATAKIGAAPPAATPPAVPAPAITPLAPGTAKTQLPQDKVVPPLAAPIQPAAQRRFSPRGRIQWPLGAPFAPQ